MVKFALLTLALSLSLNAAETRRYEHGGVLCNIKPNNSKVLLYKNKVRELFAEFDASLPDAPDFRRKAVKGHIEDINHIIKSCESKCSYNVSNQAKTAFFTVETCNTQFDRWLLLARGEADEARLAWLESGASCTVNKTFNFPGCCSESRQWTVPMSFVRECLNNISRPFRGGGRVAFFAIGYSNLTLELLREILEFGIVIHELLINDVVIEYESSENKSAINVYYDPESIKDASLDGTNFILAVSSSGGLSKSFSLTIDSN